MDFTKYAPKKPLMPSLFSGISPTPKMPSLSPTPAKPVTPMVTAPTSAPAPTPTVAPTVTKAPTTGSTGSTGSTPVVNTGGTKPVVPDYSGIMESLKGISASLGNLKDTPAPSTTPTKPEIPELSATEKTITSLMNPGSEELTTQGDLDKLIDSTKTGYLNVENKAIPMEFITGQKSAIEKRATNLAEPLERKLARLQAQRTAALEASKFTLERGDKKEAAAAKAKETEFDQKYKMDTLAETKRKTDQDYALSKEKFDEDVRQFGLTYAQNARKIAIDEAKAAGEAGGGAKATEQKLEALALAKELRGAAAGKGSAVGASLAKFVPFGQSLGLQGNRSAFEAKVETLKSNLTLENLKLLKGAMSDKDLAFLQAIGSSLNTNMTESQFNAELDKIIGKLETATGTGEAPETMVLNGKTLYRQADGTYE